MGTFFAIGIFLEFNFDQKNLLFRKIYSLLILVLKTPPLWLS